MLGNLRLLSGEQAAQLLEEPSGIHALLYGSGMDEPPPVDPQDELCIDKAWHGLHFALTGSVWEGAAPLNFIAKGGTEVGDEDVGYGPARAFTVAEVRAIHQALEKLDEADAERRFQPATQCKVDLYPWNAGHPADWADIVPVLRDVKRFIAEAAARERALLCT
jgi:hypothetical protein